MSTDQRNLQADELDRPMLSQREPRLLQFSLGTMFLITLAVAIACSLVFSMPYVVGAVLLVLFSMTLAAVLITIVVYGHGFQRTFCIGALVPFGVLLVTLAFCGVIFFIDGPPSPQSEEKELICRLVVVAVWASSIFVGGICVWVRRLVEKRRT